MRPLQLNRAGNIMTPSDTVQSVLLTTSAQLLDIPAGAQFANFSANSDFYMNPFAAAAVPTTSSSLGTTALTCSDLNPTIRDFHSTQKTTNISVIAPTPGGILCISWFGP